MTMKKAIQYTLSIGLSAILIWSLYKDQSLTDLSTALGDVHMGWLALTLAAATIAYLARALRWSITLRPVGYTPSLSHIFMALMGGYFANAVVPRLGEVIRCTLLKTSDDIPMDISLGTVVLERVVDMAVFIALCFCIISLEYRTLGHFLEQHVNLSRMESMVPLLIGGAILGGLLLGAAYLKRAWLTRFPIIRRIIGMAQGFGQGLLSIRQLGRKQAIYYVAYTILIWSMYLLMTYMLFPAYSGTAHLGISAALSCMVMGGLGMIIPTPGGTGSFHWIITMTLIAYLIPEKQAATFAFLLHGTQTLFVLVVGGLSLLMLNISKAKQRKQAEMR